MEDGKRKVGAGNRPGLVAGVTTAWGWRKLICFVHTETLPCALAVCRALWEAQKDLRSSGEKRCVLC